MFSFYFKLNSCIFVVVSYFEVYFLQLKVLISNILVGIGLWISTIEAKERRNKRKEQNTARTRSLILRRRRFRPYKPPQINSRFQSTAFGILGIESVSRRKVCFDFSWSRNNLCFLSRFVFSSCQVSRWSVKNW